MAEVRVIKKKIIVLTIDGRTFRSTEIIEEIINEVTATIDLTQEEEVIDLTNERHEMPDSASSPAPSHIISNSPVMSPIIYTPSTSPYPYHYLQFSAPENVTM